MKETENKVIQEEVYKSGSVQYIDSREVAEMVGKEHKKLLRDIRTYINQIKEINEGQNPICTNFRKIDKVAVWGFYVFQ